MVRIPKGPSGKPKKNSRVKNPEDKPKRRPRTAREDATRTIRPSDIDTPPPGPLPAIAGDIAARVHDIEKSESDLDLVPTFDIQRLQNEMVLFLAKMKRVIPAERIPDLEKANHQIKLLIAEIGLKSNELRNLHVELSPEQRQKLNQVIGEVAMIPRLREDFFEHVEKIWHEILNQLIDLLNEFKTKGVNFIASANENGFHINPKYIKKLLQLFEEFSKTGPKLAQRIMDNVMTREENEERQKLKQELRKKYDAKPIFGGANAEDLTDEEIDQMWFDQIIADIDKNESPEVIARKLMIAITMNFRHMENGIANQKIDFLRYYLEDIDSGVESRNFDSKVKNAFFNGEINALASFTSMLGRSVSVILASQKLTALVKAAKKK